MQEEKKQHMKLVLFNTKILQHPQWKGLKEVQLLSYYLFIFFIKKGYFKLHTIFF